MQTRLIDRLMTIPVQPRAFYAEHITRSQHEEMVGHLREAIRDLPVLVVDEECEYVFAENDQEEWEVGRDFTCLTPPFAPLWIEYRRPSRIVSCEHGRQSTKHFPYSQGLFCRVVDGREVDTGLSTTAGVAAIRQMTAHAVEWTIPQERQMIILDRVKRLAKEHGAPLSWDRLDDVATFDERQWLQRIWEMHMLEPDRLDAFRARLRTMRPHLLCLSFIELEKGAIYGPIGWWSYPLDVQQAVHKSAMGIITAGPPPMGSHRIGDMNAMIFPVLWALTRLQGKRDGLILHQPGAADSRAHRRRYGRPLRPYYTLSGATCRDFKKEDTPCSTR